MGQKTQQYERLSLPDNATSSAYSGSELAQVGPQSGNTYITAQIKPSGNSNFVVLLEAGVNKLDGIDFTEIGRYTQDSDTMLSVFPISLGTTYRFRLLSGIPVQCILSG